MVLHRVWKITISFVSIAIVIYFVFTLFMIFIQSKMIYFPNVPGRGITVRPDDIGLPFEEVCIETTDKVSIYGWFIPAKNQRGVILFCHGNAGNISHRLESIQIFNQLGLSTFIFDYRGYGQSQGKVSEKGTYLDAEAAWDYLVQKKRIPPSEIIVFGRSLGGSIAAYLVQDKQPKGLIVESTFSSIRDIGSDLYPYLPVRLISRFNYDSKDYIKNVNCPVLVVHSTDDEMISIEHGRRLFEAADEPKEFLEIEGTHNEGIIKSRQQYIEGLASFISKLDRDYKGG
jgi:fermentation-respiration switch protein FrsA (DUF1100 family)